MNWEIIIIGGGLGGLTAGAKLAREGKKVLLVEQHDRPGGCATTFKRKGFTMEVGLHEMDGLHGRDLKVRMFRDLGILDRVEFLELPEFYRFCNGRQNIVIHHNPGEAQAALTKNFPGEEEGIKAYFNQVLNARKKIAESSGKPERTVGEFMDSITGNEDLKLVLLANLGYFSDDPYNISLNYYSVAQGSYYGGRANFIKGGSQILSNTLASIIEDNGGTVMLNTLATRVITKKGKAVAVEITNIRNNNGESRTEHSGEIIVNSALPALANKLLDKETGGTIMKEISKEEIGPSLLTVYFGFNKPLIDTGSGNYSVFVYDESVKCLGDIIGNNHADYSTRSFTFVDYSQIDSALAPEGKSVGAVCCIDYTDDWENLSGEEYNNRKKWVSDIFTERLEILIPGFSDAVEYCEVATSLTIRRYTLNPQGSVYGFAQRPGRTLDYLNALPENLHIASAWGRFGGGFSGAIIGGYMTAVDILRKR